MAETPKLKIHPLMNAIKYVTFIASAGGELANVIALSMSPSVKFVGRPLPFEPPVEANAELLATYESNPTKLGSVSSQLCGTLYWNIRNKFQNVRMKSRRMSLKNHEQTPSILTWQREIENQ
jgi:hypothetical protein